MIHKPRMMQTSKFALNNVKLRLLLLLVQLGVAMLLKYNLYFTMFQPLPPIIPVYMSTALLE